MNLLNKLSWDDQCEVDELKNDSTVKFMREFLTLPTDRKLVILKSYITYSDGVTESDIKNILRNVTNHFSLSVARNKAKIRELINSRIGLNHNSSKINRG